MNKNGQDWQRYRVCYSTGDNARHGVGNRHHVRHPMYALNLAPTNCYIFLALEYLPDDKKSPTREGLK